MYINVPLLLVDIFVINLEYFDVIFQYYKKSDKSTHV